MVEPGSALPITAGVGLLDGGGGTVATSVGGAGAVVSGIGPLPPVVAPPVSPPLPASVVAPGCVPAPGLSTPTGVSPLITTRFAAARQLFFSLDSLTLRPASAQARTRY